MTSCNVGVIFSQVAELKRRTQEQAGRLKEAEAAAEAARREAARVRLHAHGGLSLLLYCSGLRVLGMVCFYSNAHACDVCRQQKRMGSWRASCRRHSSSVPRAQVAARQRTALERTPRLRS